MQVLIKSGLVQPEIQKWILCAKNSSGEIEYYQTAWQLTDNSTIEREFGALERIHDNYPKYLLTTDSFTQNRNGVKHLNVFNWLLGTNEKQE